MNLGYRIELSMIWKRSKSNTKSIELKLIYQLTLVIPFSIFDQTIFKRRPIFVLNGFFNDSLRSFWWSLVALLSKIFEVRCTSYEKKYIKY